MKSTSLRFQIGVLFLIFVSLVVAGFNLTYRVMDAQQHDALVINLAGRQRMLLQKMTLLATELVEDKRTAEYQADMTRAITTFEQTLSAFEKGGPAPYLDTQVVILPRAESPAIQTRLQVVRSTWEQFRALLETLNANPAAPETLSQVQALAPLLVTQADQVVVAYEQASAAKVARLRRIQIAFVVGILILLALSGWLLRRQVFLRLAALQGVAARIGAQDLETPVEIVGPPEVQALAQNMDAMRIALRQSRQDLQTWAETLEQRVAQRTHELETLNQVAREITSRLDTTQVLQTITTRARELLGAETATLCLLNEQGDQLNMQIHSGPAEVLTGKRTAKLDDNLRTVVQSERALLCTQANCRWQCGILQSDFHHEHLAVPLQVEGRPLGALCVGVRQEQAFPSDADELLTRLANSAAVALQNAQLYTQAEHIAALEERQRIAADMHDGLGQVLSSLGLLVDQAQDALAYEPLERFQQRLERIRQVTTEAIRTTRQAIDVLLQAPSQPASLQTRLDKMLQALQTDVGVVLAFHDHNPPVFLPETQWEQVKHIVGEAVWNACRHGHARHIQVELTLQEDALLLKVIDDGCGFNPQKIPQDDRKHFGLQLMQMRANYLQGNLRVISTPEQGTCVALSIPRVAQGEAQYAPYARIVGR